MERVNEEDEDGNYVIQLKKEDEWKYVTTEFSISVAILVAINLTEATDSSCRVLSRRSGNQELFLTSRGQLLT